MNDQCPVIPGLGLKSSALVHRLKDGKIGDEVTDEELTEIIRLDTAPGGKGYPYLQSALRHLEQSANKVWRRTKKEGRIRRMSDSECVDVTEGYLKHIARTARRARAVSSAIDYGVLSNEDRIRANKSVAITGVLLVATSAKVRADLLRASPEVDTKQLIGRIQENMK